MCFEEREERRKRTLLVKMILIIRTTNDGRSCWKQRGVDEFILLYMLLFNYSRPTDEPEEPYYRLEDTLLLCRFFDLLIV